MERLLLVFSISFSCPIAVAWCCCNYSTTATLPPVSLYTPVVASFSSEAKAVVTAAAVVQYVLLFFFFIFSLCSHSYMHSRASASRSASRSGILYLSPVPEHSCTGLGPLIPVADWFRHRNFCSFRYQTDWMPGSQTFWHLKKAVAGGGERDNPCTSKLHVVELIHSARP
jgi:hypothetical protein